MAKPHFLQRLNSIAPGDLDQLQLIKLRMNVSRESFTIEEYGRSEMPAGVMILLKWILDLYKSASELNRLEISPLVKKMDPDLKRKVLISKRKMESIRQLKLNLSHEKLKEHLRKKKKIRQQLRQSMPAVADDATGEEQKKPYDYITKTNSVAKRIGEEKTKKLVNKMMRLSPRLARISGTTTIMHGDH